MCRPLARRNEAELAASQPPGDEDECKQPHRMDAHFDTEGAPKSWRKRRLTHEKAPVGCSSSVSPYSTMEPTELANLDRADPRTSLRTPLPRLG